MQGLRGRLVFLVVFTTAVLAIAGVAHAHGSDGHFNGNPGSVKVDDDDIDDGPATHTHVLCALQVVIEHGVGFPFDIDFLAMPPTTRAGNDQRLLILHVPAGDNVSGLVDLSGLVSGIVAQAQQGIHILVTAHLPGGDKHKVIWVLMCPPSSTSSTSSTTSTTAGSTTSTTAHGGSTTSTTVGGTTSSTVSGGALTNTSIPTEVLGENFTKPAVGVPAATSLANTGSPFTPALAVGLVVAGLFVLGGARHVSGRRLELDMRRVDDRRP
ncbi:MAG: hypothetical protein JO086_06090 [Acidimicrobiia bacterium]|nr:hypothetical protein [Acidimicrobiia bacterium]